MIELKPAATRVAIIGAGYWGTNYLRVFSELGDATSPSSATAERIALMPSVAVVPSESQMMRRRRSPGPTPTRSRS